MSTGLLSNHTSPNQTRRLFVRVGTVACVALSYTVGLRCQPHGNSRDCILAYAWRLQTSGMMLILTMLGVMGVVAATATVRQKQSVATKEAVPTCVRCDAVPAYCARAVVDSLCIVAVRYSNYAVYIIVFSYYVGYGRYQVVV
jgi:hypothetical protein